MENALRSCQKNISYQNTRTTAQRPSQQPSKITNSIPVNDLFDLVFGQIRVSDEFSKEYSILPDHISHPHKASSKPENQEKNRFQDIPAYDHSRVILGQDEAEDEDNLYMNINTSGKQSRANQTQSAGETPSSDYINANFVHGHTLERQFIATFKVHGLLQ